MSSRYVMARNFKKKKLSSGNITLNQTAVTNVSIDLDIKLRANVGDVIEYGLSGSVTSANTTVGFDVYTVVSSTTVNPFGAGLSAALASTAGVPGWIVGSSTISPISGSILRELLIDDIESSGIVTLRLRYAQGSTDSRILRATADAPLTVWARNLGPADDEDE